MYSRNPYSRRPGNATSPVSDYNIPRSATGSGTSFGSFSAYQHGSPESNLYNVRTSEAYRVAYELFSPLSDKQWLTRLEAIASRSAVGSPSWTDDLGLTQDYQKRQIEAYNTAIADIQNLIDSYYKWVNTLPVTQVQQASDAGVNLAVSGDISGSSQASVPSSRSQLSGEGTDSTGVVTGAVSSVASIMSVLSGLYQNVASIEMARKSMQVDENKFTSNFWRLLSDSGFDMKNVSFANTQELVDWLGNNFNAETMNRSRSAGIKEILSQAEWAPYAHFFYDDETGTTRFDGAQLLAYVTGAESDSELSSILNDYATYDLQIRLLNKAYELNSSRFNSLRSSKLDGISSGEAQVEQDKMNKANSLYLKAKADLQSKFLSNFAERFNNTKNPADKFALQEILFGMDVDDQAYMELSESVGSTEMVKVLQTLLSFVK